MKTAPLALISLPTGQGYNYSVDWGDGSSTLNAHTGTNSIHNYAEAGTYTVVITPANPGAFPRMIVTGNDKAKLLQVDQWGNTQWRSMQDAFADCENLQITALDAPDLSQGRIVIAENRIVSGMSLSGMFSGCTALTGRNGSFANWDVSDVSDMSGMFRDAAAFNVDLSGWNVSRVNNMAVVYSIIGSR